MYDDLLYGVINNYYKSPNGEIVRVFAIELQDQDKSASSYFRAYIVKELRQEKDVLQGGGDVKIPLITWKLIEYKRIPEREIQELRNKEKKLETICQSSSPTT